MKAEVVLKAHTDTPQVVNPETGEVLALADAPATVLALVLGVIAEQTDDLKEARRLVGREMISRMDRSGEWTQRGRGVKVSAPSPAAATFTWDAELLDSILADLVKEGVIDQSARLRACSSRIEMVPHHDGLQRLLKIPAVADRITIARTQHDPPARTVTVKRER